MSDDEAITWSCDDSVFERLFHRYRLTEKKKPTHDVPVIRFTTPATLIEFGCRFTERERGKLMREDDLDTKDSIQKEILSFTRNFFP